MTANGQWTLDASDGELLLHTGVTGTAARMGHRLTIAMRSWQATVQWSGDDPVEVAVTVDLESLDVIRGEGGVTPLSGAEKKLVRANATKSLRTGKFPHARFRSAAIERDTDVIRLIGTLELNGRAGEQTVDIRVEDDGGSWRISGAAVVAHTDFGIKRYSMMMGAMKVADEVEVTFTAGHPKSTE
ncbi:YceI family protein [Mycolicibacterium wolinskyi]|uniref:YceI family protein n=1 Tax=Mycolicibacterium wolinskyi TaxID=59750 RepID=UPI0039178CC4